MKAILLLASLLLVTKTYSTPACQNKISISNMDESASQGTWYIFASSKRCDNCCFIRYATTAEPARFNVTDYFKRPNDSTPITITYAVNRKSEEDTYEYKIGNATKRIAVMAMNYSNYAVTFNEEENNLRVLTRNPNQEETFLDSVGVLSQCKLKVYKYNPAVACEN